jgi:Uma2 family endonuclease
MSLATNLLGLFTVRCARSRCRVYDNDLLFRTGSGEMYTYPDVMVICGGLETFAGRPHVATNPVFVAEC